MIYNQNDLEIHEDRVLAPYGNRSRESKGRIYPEQAVLEKTNYQLDRDRIRSTHAFQRLEYKSQVLFSKGINKPRTRLVHTFEVVQTGRTIARGLGANEDLVEALCLVRDLGNTAFGLAGELTLARLMKDYGLFDCRINTLRIITARERLSKEFPGINPTWEVREGLVKLDPPLNSHIANEYNPDLQAHLEAQIASAAYNITSDSFDLVDGLLSKLISIDFLQGVTIWEVLLENSRINGTSIDEISLQWLLRSLIDYLINDLLQASEQNILDNKINSSSDVQHLSFNIVAFSSDMHRRIRQLKDFLYTNLYNHHKIVRKTKVAEKIFCDLFEAFQSDPILLPGYVQGRTNENGLEQTICEYLADLSDFTIVSEHKKLFDPTTLL